MNKFATFTVLVLASVAIQASCSPAELLEGETMSQAAIRTTDTEETAKLADAGLLAFSDFCLSSRSYILSDIKTKSATASSAVFAQFFNSINEMTRNALTVQEENTSRLTQELANSEADLQAQPKALYEAVRDNGATTFQNFMASLSQRLVQIKAIGSLDNFVSALKEACNMVNVYENELQNQLTEYKASSLNGEHAELTLTDIPCATSAKIVRANGFCSFGSVAAGPVQKIYSTFRS